MTNKSDYIFVAEPDCDEKLLHGNSESINGFVMLTSECKRITAECYERLGKSYTVELKTVVYHELEKSKLYDLSFEEWKQLSPKI